MEVLTTPNPSHSQHCLSYNELKRRRLQRSISNKKITVQHQPSQHQRRHLTEQKSLISKLPKDQKVIEGVINELNHVLGDIRRKKSQKGFFSSRQSTTGSSIHVSKSEKVENTERKVQPLWNNVQQNGQTKQFIKLLLNKNKSQRRLMRVNEVRDRVKIQKQKSQSKVNSTKQAISQRHQKKTEKKDTTKEENDNHEDKSKFFIETLDEKIEKLTNCPQNLKDELWKQEIIGKENQEKGSFSIETEQVSAIQPTQEADDSIQQYQTIFDKTHHEGSLLKLLKERNEKQNRLPKCETKRKSEIERIRKIFPEGFFAH